MHDRLLLARTKDGSVSLVAGTTTELVREAQTRHALSPTASAALGRLMTGAALLGTNLKGRERLTLQIQGDGPLRSVVAEAYLLDDRMVGVRGYVQRPHVDLPLNSHGKFDVAAAVGSGRMQVTRSYDVGQPYVGVVPLATGEIGDDVAAYLLQSEQIPSVVALGVLANPSGIAAAGGAIVQVLPGADEAAIAQLEQRARSMPPITTQISAGAGPEELVDAIAGPVPRQILGEYGVRFACRCTKAKVETALVALGIDELLKLAREQAETEALCDFCRERYVLSSAELRALALKLADRDQLEKQSQRDDA